MVGLLDLPLDVLKIICDDISWPVEQMMFTSTCTWIWKNKQRLGFNYDSNPYICYHAAYFGHFNIVQHCYLNGAQIRPETLCILHENHQFQILSCIAINMCDKLKRKLKQYEHLTKLGL